jgi:prolyl 4-hydroxylase
MRMAMVTFALVVLVGTCRAQTRAFTLGKVMSDTDLGCLIRASEGEAGHDALIDDGMHPDGVADLVVRRASIHAQAIRACHAGVDEVGGVLAAHLALAPSLAEAPQLVRYEEGGLFLPHHDYFPEGMRELQGRGQRVATCIVYVRVAEDGGETRFTAGNVTVPPVRGGALCWWNVGPDGAPDPNTLHESTPVTRGSKLILAFFFRER